MPYIWQIPPIRILKWTLIPGLGALIGLTGEEPVLGVATASCAMGVRRGLYRVTTNGVERCVYKYIYIYLFIYLSIY